MGDPSLSRGLAEIRQGCRRKSYTCLRVAASAKAGRQPLIVPEPKGSHLQYEYCVMHSNAISRYMNMVHPLDKIFGGIPAGSSDFAALSEGLLSWVSFH
jgi:hypothetical protein